MFVNLSVWNFELLWSPILVLEFQIFTTGSAESDFNDWQVSFLPLSCYRAVHLQLKPCLSACQLDCFHGLSFKHFIYFMLSKSVVLYWKLSFITLYLFRPFYIFITGIPQVTGTKHWKQIPMFVTVFLVQLVTNTATLLTLYCIIYSLLIQ